ncbi:PAS domain-containing protein [Paractinoplanes deccanensis]|uniref:PAS domain-containing protein n=1 Tax=Paractinoplanes deccanensis TaxID=113561 RepID=UPI001EF2D696|nr:PAS domain-containing protein [Actinoplanes deccanensis]
MRWHRPARRWPWLLLAAAVAGLATGDVFYAFGEHTVADACYLAMYVMVALALLQFTSGGSLLDDRARLIDLLAFACAGLLVIWVFLVNDAAELGQISAADVIGTVLLVAVAVRLLLATGRNVSAGLLVVGSVGLLASDIAYPLAPGSWAETGFRVLYVTWGLAALHPSMARVTQPMTPRPPAWHGHWAVLLVVSVATPPLVLFIESITGAVEDGVAIAAAGAITLTLTITRLADAVTLNSRALARERGLRGANADLVAAADLPSVDEAVRSAVVALIPAQLVRRVVFATDDRQLALEALPPAPSGRRPRSWWTDESASEEATLVCPLWLEPLAVARPSGGALVLTGRRDALAAARDALEVLAGQAALALDRISLVEAVGRRDSDLYLRAVIRNTAELMLVLDEDQRVRYASPGLHDLLGDDDLSPLSTFADLVDPDDQGQIRRAFATGGDGTMFCALRRPDHSRVLVEATYRDLREDRLVQGFVVTMRNVTERHNPAESLPHREHLDDLPAWVNRRSAQHKFRY